MSGCLLVMIIDPRYADIDNLQITGTIVAPNQQSAWNSNEHGMWLQFYGIFGLTIGGGGVINGQGQDWWSKFCKVHEQHVSISISPSLFFTVLSHSLTFLHLSTIEYPHMTPSSSPLTSTIHSGLSKS